MQVSPVNSYYSNKQNFTSRNVNIKSSHTNLNQYLRDTYHKTLEYVGIGVKRARINKARFVRLFVNAFKAENTAKHAKELNPAVSVTEQAAKKFEITAYMSLREFNDLLHNSFLYK